MTLRAKIKKVMKEAARASDLCESEAHNVSEMADLERALKREFNVEEQMLIKDALKLIGEADDALQGAVAELYQALHGFEEE